ncbi:hypothetical protein EAF00_005856 [Botryotinia globosa]|nr:hypothetical protein EAF00_005856 [Botryotinia globosa]
MLHASKGKGNDEEESHPLVENASESAQIKSFRRFSPQQPNIWIFTTFLLAFLLFASGIRDYVRSKQNHPRQYDYEIGFETEWFSPDEPVYVGPPSPEIDDAWQALLHNESIAVTPEEAKEVSDRSAYDKYRSHYTVGLDVLHSLHCPNAIRMAQDVDYYRAQGFHEEWWARFHIDHCINHLRQVIQCHGNLKPTPLVPASRNASKKGWITPDFDVVHTCRDFKAIREWSTEKLESGVRKSRLAAQKQSSSD